MQLLFVMPIFCTNLIQFLAQISQMADDTGLDFSDQINALEGKYQQVLRGLPISNYIRRH